MEWKASKRFTNPFAPLQLSPEAAAELEALANAFVTQSVRTYERFVLDENREVDAARWKFMYQKDDVRSYAERSGFSAASEATPGGPQRARSRSSSTTPDPPIVLVEGTTAGDLDDTIYGFLCPTLDMMRLKTSYIKDTMHRACVLASLVNPTPDEPFRSVSIKWVEKGQPLHVRAVIKNRDFVYMEATGVRFLRNGERVGYQLVHSVQFPETPARDSAIRGNMSMTAVYRQRAQNVTDVFIKGFLNPAGGLARSIITRSAAKALLSVSKNVHCAQMKKLAWCIRQKRAASEGRKVVPTSDTCVACHKTPSSARQLLHKRRACSLCWQYVCSSCRVDKPLHFMLADRRLLEQSIPFCARCLQEALATKTQAVATHELLFNDIYGWSEAYVSSGTEISLLGELN